MQISTRLLLSIALTQACSCHACRCPCRYESTQDGFIDRDEFAAGLARMGLSFDASSLALDDAQQGQLLEALFRDAAAGPASDRVSHDVFDANLAAVRGLDFMADSYMLLDPWCYNSRCGWLSVRHALAEGALACAVVVGCWWAASGRDCQVMPCCCQDVSCHGHAAMGAPATSSIYIYKITTWRYCFWGKTGATHAGRPPARLHCKQLN
jgi:hypothetical protein